MTRFDLPTLIAVVTGSAIHMALFARSPVFSLSLATLAMLLFFVVRRAHSGDANDGQLLVVGTIAGFAWMTIFGGATFACHYVYNVLTDNWPDPDDVHIDTPTAIFVFTIIYSGLAALTGCLVGCFATIFVNFRAKRFETRDGG